MKHYRLFQAWQNQNKEYTDFVTRTIQAVVALQRDKGIDIEVVRFPAQDEAGSPDVVGLIWEQIANCDLFVGDVTSIAEVDGAEISNSNVMYEVGIADALLGSNRVILLCNKETDISHLAFDINHKRISPLNIKNENAVEFLNEWIDAGIKECDIQQSVRDFVFKSIQEDMYVAYNNFMRLVYYDDFDYHEGVQPPKLISIIERLRNCSWNELMVSVDYDGVLNRLKQEIEELYRSKEQRFLHEIVEVYNALDKYNWFVHTIQKDIAFCKEDKLIEVLLQNTKAFYLTSVDGADSLYQSVLFEEKYVYINGDPPFQNVFFREMLSVDLMKLCHCQNVDIGQGKLTGLKMATYSVNSNAVETMSSYIYDVLDSIFKLMDKMNFHPTNIGSDIKCNTIITWVKNE